MLVAKVESVARNAVSKPEQVKGESATKAEAKATSAPAAKEAASVAPAAQPTTTKAVEKAARKEARADAKAAKVDGKAERAAAKVASRDVTEAKSAETKLTVGNVAPKSVELPATASPRAADKGALGATANTVAQPPKKSQPAAAQPTAPAPSAVPYVVVSAPALAPAHNADSLEALRGRAVRLQHAMHLAQMLARLDQKSAALALLVDSDEARNEAVASAYQQLNEAGQTYSANA